MMRILIFLAVVGTCSAEMNYSEVQTCGDVHDAYQIQCCGLSPDVPFVVSCVRNDTEPVDDPVEPTEPEPELPPMTVKYDPLMRRALESANVDLKSAAFEREASIDVEGLLMLGRRKTSGILMDDLYIVWGSDFINPTSVIAIDTLSNTIAWELKGFENGGGGRAGYVDKSAKVAASTEAHVLDVDLSTVQPGDTLRLKGAYQYPGGPGEAAQLGYYAFVNNFDALIVVRPRSLQPDSSRFSEDPGEVFTRIPGTLEYVSSRYPTPKERVAELQPGSDFGSFYDGYRGVKLREEGDIANAATGNWIVLIDGAIADFYNWNDKPYLQSGDDFPILTDDTYDYTVTEAFLADYRSTDRPQSSVFTSDGPNIALRSIHVLETNKLLVTSGDAYAIIDANTGLEIMSKRFEDVTNLDVNPAAYSVMGLGTVGSDRALFGLAEANYHFKKYDEFIHPPDDAGGAVFLLDLYTGEAKWEFNSMPVSLKAGDVLPAEAFAPGQQTIETHSELHDGMLITSDSLSGTRPTTRSPKTLLRAGRLVLEAGTVIPSGSFFHHRRATLVGVDDSSIVLNMTADQADVAIAADMQYTFLEEKFDFSSSITDVEGVFNQNLSYTGRFVAADGGSYWVKTKGSVFLDEATTSSRGIAMPLFQQIVTSYHIDMVGSYAFQSANEAKQFGWWGGGQWQNGYAPLVTTPNHPDGIFVLTGGGGSRVPRFVVERHRMKMDAMFIEMLRVQVGAMLIASDWDLADAVKFEAARQRLTALLEKHEGACTSDPMHSTSLYELSVAAFGGKRQKDYVDALKTFVAQGVHTAQELKDALALAQEYQIFAHHLATEPRFMSPMERRTTQGSVYGLSAKDGSLVFNERLVGPDNYFSPGLDTMALDVAELGSYGGLWQQTELFPLEADFMAKYQDFPGYNSDNLNAGMLYEDDEGTHVLAYDKLQILRKITIVDETPQLIGVSNLGISGVKYRMPTKTLDIGPSMPVYSPGGVSASWMPTLTESAFYAGVTNYQPVPFVIAGDVIKPHVGFIVKVDMPSFTLEWHAKIPRLSHQPGTLVVGDAVLTTDAYGGMHMFDDASGAFVRSVFISDAYALSDTNMPIVTDTHMYWQPGNGWSTSQPWEFSSLPYNYPEEFLNKTVRTRDEVMHVWKL